MGGAQDQRAEQLAQDEHVRLQRDAAQGVEHVLQVRGRDLQG
ncbi:hypothetical protein [Streptomyces sp. NPDC001165]